MKWSRSFFSKVLGGVFCICSVATASQYDEALGAARQAAYIQSGLRQNVDTIKRYYVDQAKNFISKEGLRVEASVLGTAIQTIQSKSVSIKYDGVQYFVSPSEIRVQFSF